MEREAWRILSLPGRRPIVVAMAISTVIHAAILVLLGANLDLGVTGKESPDLSLAVVLEVPESGDDEQMGMPGAEAADASLAADRSDAPEQAPSLEPVMRASAEASGNPVISPEPDDSHATGPEPDSFETAAPAVLADLSMTGLISTPPAPEPVLEVAVPKPVLTAPEAPEKIAAYSPQQQSMLARKIEDWAQSYHHAEAPDEEVAWTYKGQRYTARFTSLPGGDDTELDRVIVRVTTGSSEGLLATTIRMKRLAFSNYAQFVNRWDDSVQIHDDELEGRFHTNSELNLSYSRTVAPRFLGKVTTSARRVSITEESGYRSRDEIFQGGLETGVRSIRLPRDYVPLPDSLSIREEQLHEFAEDTRITFHADGSYSWIPLESEQPEQHGKIRQPASYLVALDEAELHVAGMVAGKVLVFSPTRILITGSLRYATDPETTGNGDDYLGLVSAGTVEVAEPSVTGPGDLHIHGAIYARRLFRVRDYRHRDNATLEIYGSLTAGSLSATEPRYATRIRFDPRLESRRPPGFPVTDRYELESWDGVWTVEQ